MTADIERQDDLELEAFFEALREEAETPSPDLLARVLADAYEEQDAAMARPVEVPPELIATLAAPKRGLMAGLLDAIGGWPAVAGLATATVAGVWIGYNPPALVDDFTYALLDGSYSVGLGAAQANFDDLPAEG